MLGHRSIASCIVHVFLGGPLWSNHRFLSRLYFSFVEVGVLNHVFWGVGACFFVSECYLECLRAELRLEANAGVFMDLKVSKFSPTFTWLFRSFGACDIMLNACNEVMTAFDICSFIAISAVSLSFYC